MGRRGNLLVALNASLVRFERGTPRSANYTLPLLGVILEAVVAAALKHSACRCAVSLVSLLNGHPKSTCFFSDTAEQQREKATKENVAVCLCDGFRGPINAGTQAQTGDFACATKSSSFEKVAKSKTLAAMSYKVLGEHFSKNVELLCEKKSVYNAIKMFCASVLFSFILEVLVTLLVAFLRMREPLLDVR